MASYHLTVKNHSRSKNANAVALASYRSGERLWDERQMLHKDCRKNDKSEVLHSELFNSYRMNREQLWNAAEAAENRKNSVVAREIEIALPVDISNVQKVALARDFCKELVGRYRCAIDLAVHAPDADGDQRNYHAHILMTTREVGVGGMGAKWRQLNQPNGAGHIEMAELRKKFELLQNSYLERAGVQERVSCGRASEMDIPRKYVALPFSKYQVMRREGRVEEYKEVSGYEEFVRWKSRKELEIEDLAGELELAREREELEQKMESDIYYYDPVSAQIDAMAVKYEERKELEQRSEDYGLNGNEPRAGVGAVERVGGIGGVEEGFGDTGIESGDRRDRGQEQESGGEGQSHRITDSERSEQAWRRIEGGYRRVPEFVEGHVEQFRERSKEFGKRSEELCGEIGKSVQRFDREAERQLDRLRTGVNKRIAGVDRGARQNSRQAQQDIESFNKSSVGEQRRRAARVLRRGSYAHAIERIGRRIRRGFERFRETVRQVRSFFSGGSAGRGGRRFRHYIAHVIKPAFKDGELLPEVDPVKKVELERVDPVRISAAPGIRNMLLPDVPAIDEKKRLQKLELLGEKQSRSVEIIQKSMVEKAVAILKKYEAGREILASAVDDRELSIDAEDLMEEISAGDKKKLFGCLKWINQGVNKIVERECPEIVAQVEEKKKFRVQRGRDDGPERGFRMGR